jgi:pSer/pThr/pTyr-binding forkhead associated (FHA) protein
MAVKLVVRHLVLLARDPARPEGGELPQGEMSFEFEQARIAIGRSKGADVRLPGLGVSELHATIEVTESQARLRDEGSTNGTRVNGVALIPSRQRSLSPGDEIEIGEFALRFESGPLLGSATGPERTASLARRLLREVLGPDSLAAKPACLRITAGPDQGTVVNLGEPPSSLVIGRGEEAGLVLKDLDVSREHLELIRDLDGTLARDLGSKNGLEVNGKRLRERRLRHGDVVSLGASAIRYEDPAEEALKGLEGQPDRTLTRTRQVQEAVAADVASVAPPAGTSVTPEASAPGRKLEPASSSHRTDLVIYALAALILAASLAGLVWLFN